MAYHAILGFAPMGLPASVFGLSLGALPVAHAQGLRPACDKVLATSCPTRHDTKTPLHKQFLRGGRRPKARKRRGRGARSMPPVRPRRRPDGGLSAA